MMTLIIFLLVLSVLVIAHEWGHFIVARKSGMKVHEFGLGFPPRLGGIYRDPKTKKWKVVWGSGKNNLKKTVGGASREEEYPSTLYSFNWLPLGGFVRIKGENGESRKDKDSFMHHKPWKRAAVLVAGVTMNFIVAAVLLAGGLISGLPADFRGGIDDSAIVVEEPAVTIQQVQHDTPAAEAGIKFGDKIVAVNGKQMTSSVDLIEYVKTRAEQPLKLTIDREGQSVDLTVKPIILEGENTPRLGLMLADAGIIRYPWHIAIWKGIAAAWTGLLTIFVSFYLLIKNLIIGQGLLFEVSGPVGIANVVGQSAKLGMHYLINVSAMISLSLAAINILPIPALDGGRLVFVILEKVTGKPVPMKYEQTAHTIGFLLLMLLIIVVTWRDITALF
jgi:regulator of sigma E protease